MRQPAVVMFRGGLICLVGLLLLSLVPGCGAIGLRVGLDPATGGSDDASQVLMASGTIQAQAVRVATDLGGRIEMVFVEEGDQVRQGELLATLDATPWELQLGPAEAAVRVAEAELAALRVGPRSEEIAAARAAVALAMSERDGAYAAWQHALELVEAPQELDRRIVEAQGQVALAEQAVELAEAQLQPAQVNRDIRSEGTTERQVAEYQVQAAERALAAAEADLATAETVLRYLWWIRGEPLAYIAQANGAEGQYQVAKAGADVAQARLDDLLAGSTAETLAVAEAAVAKAVADADLLRLKIERCRLESPLDGVVTAQVLDIGELAAPAATILKLADLSVVQLEVYVPENRVGQVVLGQTVDVTVDSFPDHVFSGRVVKIGDQPEYTPRNVATVEERLNTFYAVEIELLNAEGRLKPGMPADAQF